MNEHHSINGTNGATPTDTQPTERLETGILGNRTERHTMERREFDDVDKQTRRERLYWWIRAVFFFVVGCFIIWGFLLCAQESDL